MTVTQYIGSRYVPIFADPEEWNNTRTYEALTIVSHEGNSYTSKQYVPTGKDISDSDFWVQTGNYNAQVENYRLETQNAVKQINESVDTLNKNIDTQNKTITSQIEEQDEKIATQIEEQESKITTQITEQDTKINTQIEEQNTKISDQLTEQNEKITTQLEEQNAFVDEKVEKINKITLAKSQYQIIETKIDLPEDENSINYYDVYVPITDIDYHSYVFNSQYSFTYSLKFEDENCFSAGDCVKKHEGNPCIALKLAVKRIDTTRTSYYPYVYIDMFIIKQIDLEDA